MLAHAVNNASAVLGEWKPVGDLAESVPRSVSLPLAAVALAAAVAAVALTRPARAAET
jgi:hypothetical protein